MKRIINIVLLLLIIMLSVISIQKEVKATDETDGIDGRLELECEDYLEKGKTITINVKLSNVKTTVDTIIAKIEYDKNIFEAITEENLVPINKWNYPEYNSQEELFLIEKTKGTTEDETIMQILLTVKEDAEEIMTTIKLTGLEIAGLGEDLKFNETAEIIVTEKDVEIPTPEDPLYLLSDIYKIGDNDITKYEKGDKYISRVEGETTKENFINNLETNGTIRIIKTSGEELKKDKLVGTGMTLEVTKGEEKIELQIAVMGDLDGNGKITATDLSAMNQVILELITIENEYYIAADFDENGKITATDLSTENGIILGIIQQIYGNEAILESRRNRRRKEEKEEEPKGKKEDELEETEEAEDEKEE